MATLPLATAFTDSAVTEGDFKTAITDQRTFLADLLGTDGTADTALRTLGAFANDVSAKSSNYTVLTSDRGVVFNCTSTFTLSLTAAATLGDGFTFAVINTGSGTITIDPNSTEQIDGANTKTIAAGSWAIVSCTGTAFITMGAVPATGALIGYQVFTSSGTYTKATNNPSFVIVEVVGGGGSGGGSSFTRVNGGTSSFGTHCTATGGSAGSTTSVGGSGGTGTGGDINVTGQAGAEGGAGGNESGGLSKYGGNIGQGGYGGTYTSGKTSISAGAGGAGGYAMKKIASGSLAASETVTVGAGGNGSGGATYDGKNGIVIVWEYQ